MNGLSTRYEDEENIRDSLLRFYSSEVTNHSALILSTFIAFFGFVSGYSNIKSMTYALIGAYVTSYACEVLIVSYALIIIVFFLVYFVGRLLYWSTMATLILYILPLSAETMKEKYLKDRKVETDDITYLARFQWACSEEAMEKGRFPVPIFADEVLVILYFIVMAILIGFVSFWIPTTVH